MRVAVVVAAAGSGSRMGAQGNKVLLPLDGKPVLAHVLACFSAMDEVRELVVVTREVDRQAVSDLVQKAVPGKRTKVVLGGADRQESVYLGLQSLTPDTDWVIIHDGARPFITPDLVRSGLQAAQEHLAVGVAVPVKDTIKKVRGGFAVETLERSELWAMQTPQVFAYDLIVKAHAWAKHNDVRVTDDCAVLEAFGHPVHIVEGDYANTKITTPEDLPRSQEFSVGLGYDVHALVADRPLILGGVRIPHEKGLLGHSDADVLTHAVMDALLGALGAGDIGELFPDTDPQFAGASSIV
ncbi:MAG TPA: 2-C-methyl-D-erythritol 4-phosphate cytidylyltransferase, partial [Firmicutes bacterium]|nr:2-C-methyl-D-erythritol 4-phosphate cytidylyltransferase [Bacillota bacterium]